MMIIYIKIIKIKTRYFILFGFLYNSLFCYKYNNKFYLNQFFFQQISIKIYSKKNKLDLVNNKLMN